MGLKAKDVTSQVLSRVSQTADFSDVAIGRRIKQAREEKGLTQQQMATRSKWADPDEKGISRTALIGYEAGTSRPGTRELRIICETLKVTPNHVLYGLEEPFQTSQFAMEHIQNTRRFILEAVQVALVVMTLRGHEQSALKSLALSLAGRELGDDRLSGLRSLGTMWAADYEDKIRETLGNISHEEMKSLPQSEIIDQLSRQLRSNLGNRIVYDEDGEIVGGEVQYPDPTL